MFFNNRDKFDLVVLYDNDSTTLGALNSKSPLSVLWKAIYETEFRKMLKQVPVLMLGGFEAWKRDVGSNVGVPQQNGSAVSGPSPSHSPLPSLSMTSQPAPPLALDSKPLSPTIASPPSTLPSIHENFQSPPSSAALTQPVSSSSQRTSPLSRSRAGTESSGHTRDAASSGYNNDRRSLDQTSAGLARKPAISRPPSVSGMNGIGAGFSRSVSDNVRLSRIHFCRSCSC